MYASMYYVDMKTKEKDGNRVQLRLWKEDYQALKALADGDGLTMTAWLVKFIRKEAKKQGIPVKDVI